MAKPSVYTTAQEIWTALLLKLMFTTNDFLSNSLDWSGFVSGKTVNYYREMSLPVGVFNRTGARNLATALTEAISFFTIDEYKTDPSLVDWTEEQVIGYDKMSSTFSRHNSVSDEDWERRLLFNWAPDIAARIIRTSGTSKPASTPNATGNRRKITYNDFVKAREIAVKDKLNLKDYYLVVPAEMYSDLLQITEFTKRENMAGQVIPSGVIGKILGFNVYESQINPLYDNAAIPLPIVPKADDSETDYAGGIADNTAVLLINKTAVIRAISAKSRVAVLDTDDGATLSTTSIGGGSKLYTDQRGVIAIVEAVI